MAAVNRTLMVMAGGTGGHVYPALAVADALRARGWEVFWLGTKSGLEARVVPAAGIDMVWVSMGGVRGKGLLKKLLLPAMLLVAFWQSLRAILQRRPDVVLGMGGYTAFPGGMMASLLNRPLVIHEQNSVGGLTNRVLACLADRVLTAFPRVFTHAHDKPIPCRHVATEWVGNPVRSDIVALSAGERAARSGPLRLLVVGGSLGATALNELVPKALALLPAEQRPQVVHQSGRQHLDALRANYAAAGVAAEVRDYIEDMAAEYRACDFAICRAGAMTVAELRLCRRARDAGALPVRGGRPPDRQCRVSQRGRCGLADAAEGTQRGKTGGADRRPRSRHACRDVGQGARAGQAGRNRACGQICEGLAT